MFTSSIVIRAGRALLGQACDHGMGVRFRTNLCEFGQGIRSFSVEMFLHRAVTSLRGLNVARGATRDKAHHMKIEACDLG